MQQLQILILSSELIKLVFVFSVGACIGSLTNVLVYRMPLGLNVVTPSSRCPKCDTKLRWNDNIPIFGWLFLRGRCRYCRCRISPEYPIVELIGALLFTVPFFLFYSIQNFGIIGWGTEWLGVDWMTIAPEWARAGGGLEHSWPIFLVIVTLLGCLLPSTIIDARTFMIPLVLTWIPAIVAVVLLPTVAAWHDSLNVSFVWADGWTWAIASPGETGWKWVGGSIGATVGLGVSIVLLKVGLLKRSYADYDEWEAKALAEEAKGKATESETKPSPSADEPASDEDADAEPDSDVSPGDDEKPSGIGRGLGAVGIVLACAAIGGVVSSVLGYVALGGVAAGLLVGPMLVGVVSRILAPKAGDSGEDCPAEGASTGSGSAGVCAGGDESPADLWLAYPHARRETVRELAFLGMPALLGLVGWIVAQRLGGPWITNPTTFQQIPATLVPLWLDVLSGVLLGYLVGGGIVWAIRIFGSLAFGKEAMGLGDVHLMAGVGACLGWIDPTLAFFLAAFVAIYLTIVGVVCGGKGQRAMPFGPALVVATLIVFLGKVGVEAAMNAWVGRGPLDLINLP